MTDQTPIELKLEISLADATTDELDQTTRSLLRELKNSEVESAELASAGSVPEGAKAVDPVTAGTIAITVLPAVLPNLIQLVQAWVMRGHGKTVKFKGKVGGQKIEFEGSPEELHKLLEKLGQTKS